MPRGLGGWGEGGVAVNHGFDPWSGQTKDYRIGISCFSAKHATLKSKSKDRLARNQDHVSEWRYTSTHGPFVSVT